MAAAAGGGGILGQIGSIVGTIFGHQCFARQDVDRPDHRPERHAVGHQ